MCVYERHYSVITATNRAQHGRCVRTPGWWCACVDIDVQVRISIAEKHRHKVKLTSDVCGAADHVAGSLHAENHIEGIQKDALSRAALA